MNYDLRKKAQEAERRPKGTRVVLTEISASAAVEADVRRAINQVLRGGRGEAGRIARAAKVDRTDLWRSDTPRSQGFTATAVERLRRIFTALLNVAERMVEGAFRLEEARHRDDFMGAVKKSIGIDLGAIVQAADVEPHIRLAVQRNVALIKGLSDDVARRLEATLLQKITEGATNAAIEETIAESFGFGRERARLIARDQASKFNGTLNRVRQEQAGITKYQWSTSRDERVRDEHAAREGKTFAWSKPPADGHPGEPVNCRCTARAVIEF